MRSINLCIPTLRRYDLLLRLCTVIAKRIFPVYPNLCVHILDNGGLLEVSKECEDLNHISQQIPLYIETPSYNLGVPGSWNHFIRRHGQCFVLNDDVLITAKSINSFLRAVSREPEATIFETDHPVAGFSMFFINKPELWLSMGGFDELLSPAYFEDNDCRYRLRLAGCPVIKVRVDDWQHDNSSTLLTADQSYRRMHWCLYRRNKRYYIHKWGGLPGHEQWLKPFNA